MPEYDIRPYRPGDEHAILETFNLVFGEGNPGFVPRSLADWEWTYTRNPSGMRVWIATCGDLVAAHYAAQPNRVLVESEQRIFGQIFDSMVHPEHRRGLKRPGLFVETALRMLDATCGPDKDLATYGWPNPDSWRIGKTFLRYEVVRRLTSLVREPGEGPTEVPAGVVAVDRADERFDRLFARCAPQWGASLVRDRAWVQWRFLDCPRHRYDLWAVPGGDAWAGYAAFRHTDWPFPGAAWLVDWLVPDDAPDVGELLLRAVLARARERGSAAIVAMFPEWSPWSVRFQDAGFLARAGAYFMCGRDNDAVHDMIWLRDHWWYQPIEVDLL